MLRIFQVFISVLTTVFMLPSMIGLGLFGTGNINENTHGDVRPDTWVAVDGLGRTLPAYEEVGDRDDEKFVGLFYWTWHYNFASGYEADNVTEILEKNPEAVRDFSHPVWENTPSGKPYHWNEPLFGYYQNLDEYVVRKHAEMIADAGVDVIIFDCTNGTYTWEPAYEVLFKVFDEAINDGVNVPQIAFLLPFSASQDANTSLRQLYEDIYSQGRYKHLWFMWDGKPLIMAREGSLDESDPYEKEIIDFFTFRENSATYFDKDNSITKNIWGWCSSYPQTKFSTSLFGGTEQMCVSVAQNAADGQLVAMNSGGNVQGRSFTHGDYSYSYKKGDEIVTVNSSTENAMLYGLNFQQQWDYAIECDPDFIFVTGWNEWIAGRHDTWQGTENAFPDQFCDEYSRDIEPSAGVLKDHYYYQLCANIRRFKGVSEPMKTSGGQTINIYGADSQWNWVENEYFHYTGSTRDRDADGWVGLHYENHTMRNDFKNVKVTYDNKNVYFRIETAEDITPYTDSAWMRILLDTDMSGKSANWEGFEYIINRDSADSSTLTVEKSTGGWSFEQTGTALYRINGNVMYLSVPRAALGLSSGTEIHFNFKLSDNMQADGDIMDFYQNGDVAPGGRFMFAV
ncbi:MAG: hypothetical protein IJ447_07070 [Clostridia bacterium]|nr:hypothetical protein [Clostridia bacterium]